MDKKFYVYVLLDPRKQGEFIYEEFKFNFEPFYVGKGTGNRTETTKQDNSNSYKFNKINMITESGLEIITIKLSEDLTEQESFEIEINAIKKIGKIIDGKGPLVNFSDGGNGGDNITYHPDYEKIVKKMSLSKIGEKNSFFGKKHSEKTLKLLSDLNKGKQCGSKNPFYGKKHTEESKKKVSEANKKNIGDKNHFFGKNHTEESKQKIREKALGREKSEDVKFRTSQTLKAKNWTKENNPFATKYIIESPSGEIIEIIGFENLKILLKGISVTRIIKEKNYKGYKLIDRIRINKKK